MSTPPTSFEVGWTEQEGAALAAYRANVRETKRARRNNTSVPEPYRTDVQTPSEVCPLNSEGDLIWLFRNKEIDVNSSKLWMPVAKTEVAQKSSEISFRQQEEVEEGMRVEAGCVRCINEDPLPLEPSKEATGYPRHFEASLDAEGDNRSEPQ